MNQIISSISQKQGRQYFVLSQRAPWEGKGMSDVDYDLPELKDMDEEDLQARLRRRCAIKHGATPP
jgi:hypothetical protein